MAHYRRLTRRKAEKYGINPDYFERQIGAESGFNPRARSPKGARGIAQIMPGTARGWRVNPDDPDAALDAAAKNMAGYLKSYGGDWRKALAAYNAGPGAVKKYGGVPPYRETRNYISKILRGGNPKARGGRPTGRPVGGRPGRVSVQVTPGELPTGTLASLLRRSEVRAPAQTAPLQAPAFSASKSLALPSGYREPASGGGPAPAQERGLAELLREVSGLSGGTVDRREVRVSPGSDPVRRGGPVGKDGIPRGAPARGTKMFEGVRVAAWIHPYLVYARRQGWKGKVNSGFRSFAEQTRIYNSGVRPAAKPGTSKHEGAGFPRGAIDVSDAEELDRILRRRGTKRLRFAGAKDPVHFSRPSGGSY